MLLFKIRNSSIKALTFVFLPPVIESFSPTSGPPGTVVTLQGKNFGLFSHNSVTVKFGNLTGIYLEQSYNDKTIYVRVPEGGSGSVTISVTVNSQTGTSTDYFTFN